MIRNGSFVLTQLFLSQRSAKSKEPVEVRTHFSFNSRALNLFPSSMLAYHTQMGVRNNKNKHKHDKIPGAARFTMLLVLLAEQTVYFFNCIFLALLTLNKNDTIHESHKSSTVNIEAWESHLKA